MDKKELKKQLEILGVNKEYYSLNGVEMPGRTIFSYSSSRWSVYNINERGKKTDEKYFNSEEDACYYMLKILKEEKDLQDRINKGYFED